MDATQREVVVSGIRATGTLHLGNYLGAIRNFPPLQEGYDCYFFVADYHTLTTAPDPQELRRHRLPIVKTFLACGIDGNRSSIFYQSAVPQIAELSLLLSMVAQVSELERCTTFKDMKAKSVDNVNLGLFSYPVLMAADILIHKAHVVPVGHDQLQHLEMARDFARRFNKQYVEIFPLPTSREHEAIRLPGLDGKKMGKSDGNAINLLDDHEVLAQKIMSAKTDEQRKSVSDKGDPENRCASIFPLYKLLASEQEQEEVRSACSAGELGCRDCKKRLIPHVERVVQPIQEGYAHISDAEAEEVLRAGSDRARCNAEETLSEVRAAMGLD